MPSTLDLCEKYFGTRDIYKLFDLTKDSLEKDIKKAYYRLSLKVHPDRVSDDEKDIATEKFKILAALHQVLSDKNKKALYDEQGIIDDDDDNIDEKLGSWLELWKKIFKPISVEDIDNFKNDYIGSEMEKTDIKKAYLNGKGCINYMMNCVPFMSVEDEPRIQEIVKEMIISKEVPEYKIFTNEPKSKRVRRHKKYAKEKLEAESIMKTMESKKDDKNEKNHDDDNDDDDDGIKSLKQQIMNKNLARRTNADSFFDKLLEKYGGSGGCDDDDSEEFVFTETTTKKITQKMKTAASASTSRRGARHNGKGVKNGRVTKKKK